MSEQPDVTRFFLIRHGEVDRAWQGRIYGCLDVPLSPRGEAEARRTVACLADELLGAVVSSGLARAEQAAALLRGTRGLERRDDPDLREIDRGEWAGVSIEELEREQPGAWASWHSAPGSTRPPAGESLADLAARVTPRLDHWAQTFAGERVAIVTHSWVIRVAVCGALALPVDLAVRLDLDTGALVVLDWPAAGTLAVGEGTVRPTLAGFAMDRPPAGGLVWFRGPHRDR